MKPYLIYIVQTIACSGMLYLFYRLLFDRKASPNFCRSYLLGFTILSAVIPVLRLPVYAPDVILAEADPIIIPLEGEGILPVIDAGQGLLPEHVIALAYGIPALALIALIAFRLRKISSLKSRKEAEHTPSYTLIESGRIKTPFSFFCNIFIPPGLSSSERSQIIAHEVSHIRHRHSVELLAMEVLKSVLWFNPFVWLACRSLAEVHEYQADRDVLDEGHDLKQYRSLIFKQLFGYAPELTSGLIHSRTKKRLLMMTKKQKSRYALLKTAALIPFLGVLLALFSFTKQNTVYLRDDQQPVTVKSTAVADSTTGRVTITSTVNVSNTQTTDGKGKTISYTTPDSTGIRPTVFVNGKPGSIEELKKIPVDSIERMEVYKGTAKTTNQPIPGQEGTIFITTKNTSIIPDDPEEDMPFMSVETMPIFEGGEIPEFRTWVMQQLKYPKELQEAGIQGRVIVSMIVNKEGKVTNIKTLVSPHRLFSAEVERVLRLSPQWTPGKQRGKAVSVIYTFPVDFLLK